ncbi:hypothetical protein [Roseiflexus castenholzii]|uniref:hypothetical protein n=1 Tax=Roseiflexus castenholzii TaxID=120962 RepID=UPI003C79E587
MIDPASQAQLREAITDCIRADRRVLDRLREEIRPLKHATCRIQPRATTSISLIGADGGNHQLRFDPFLIQLIRVVDSSNNEYCLEVVAPTTPIQKINTRQFAADDSARTALGEMMRFLGIDSLTELSPLIRPTSQERPVSPRWVEVYRELVEWGVLFAILKKDFGADTLIVCDGLLRSVVFARGLFQRLLRGMQARIDAHWRNNRRRVHLAGVAKHSKVLSRYRLAMALEGVLQTDYPAYVEVPRELEERSYMRADFAPGGDYAGEEDATAGYTGGRMFLVKFGAHRHDPIWPVDIFEPQAGNAQEILGALLADAMNGFPIPYYPRCLQKAHENAALVDFDFEVLQDFIYEGVRSTLGKEAGILDAFQLLDPDPSQQRYE